MRLTLTSNLIAIALVVPALLVLAPRYGAPAAALAWLTLNAGYILCQLHFMHRRLLRGELKGWYLKDVGKPTTAQQLSSWPQAPSSLPPFRGPQKPWLSCS